MCFDVCVCVDRKHRGGHAYARYMKITVRVVPEGYRQRDGMNVGLECGDGNMKTAVD